jgi:DNA-binding SARP family transcriptional activator
MPRDTGDASSRVVLTLTGEFELGVLGRIVRIPHNAERVLAYLALADRPVSRVRVAETLWRDTARHRAAKSLRTALWNLRRVGADLVSASDDRLCLHRDVVVDVAELTELARTLIREPTPEALERLPMLVRQAEVLPDWDQEWVTVDRERYRLLRLEALESASQTLLDRQRWGEALLAALAAVQSDPLRESARRLVIRVQLAQGNIAEALRGYHDYRCRLLEEFGVEPSSVLDELLAAWATTRPNCEFTNGRSRARKMPGRTDASETSV